MIHPDFIEKKSTYLNELKATLRELEHVPTGAQVMHIENDDPENLFCLSFETIPYNSNGVAHILEHTVLCGSKKFPVKDPFFAMIRRSLNTFMNALTGSDFTCYPAASQVEKDYYNLLDVYLDAVFHPQLKRESFLQEGHRLELHDHLEWKGVVFNEMKGALASPDTRLWHTVMEALVPDLTYSYISGGDPKEIPTLTYEQLVDFHKTYYHPSRCLFFFYGNLPLKNHLEFISEKVLNHASKLPPLPALPRQTRFTKPVEKKGYYPITAEEDLDDKTMVAWSWLTVPIQDQETVLALTLLDAVLMETDASPLKLALLQSDLCASADAFLDTDMSELPYLIICKGCHTDSVQQLDGVLKKALKEIAENGIPMHIIEAALHQLEFARTEISGDHSPFGLTLFMRSALVKQHGCPPENALLIHSLFENLRKKLEAPSFLTDLLKRYLIDNTHLVRVEMSPNATLAQREVDEEKLRLAELHKELTPEDKKQIKTQMHELQLYQKAIEGQSLDCLPRVTLDDVPVLTRDFLLHQKNEVFHHSCFTNHIIYADLVFDLPHFAEADLPYVQLLASILPELGMGKRDYIHNLEYLQSHVGSLSTSMALQPQVEHSNVMKPTFAIRGKALERNGQALLSIFREFALESRLDETDRIEELILQIHTGLQNQLQRNSLRYAVQLAVSGLTVAAKINEQWHGLSYLKFIQEIASDLSKHLPRVIEKLKSLKDTLLSCRNPHLILACDEAIYSQLEKESFYGVLDLPKKPFTPWQGSYPLQNVVSQARPIAVPVAFTAEAFKVAPYIHPHAPALTVATHLIDNKVLHPKIREQGGAYGCGATYAPMSGHFTLHAYRDPHIASTLKIFKEAIETVADGHFTASDLESAKLETIQQFDTPVSPGNRAATAYTWWREGKGKAHRQHYRDKVLTLSPQEIQLALQHELISKLDTGIVVTFASKELLEQQLENRLPIIPI